MWEYKTETFSSIFDNKRSIKEKCDTILNKSAMDGWELVNFQCAMGSIMIMVFKRAK